MEKRGKTLGARNENQGQLSPLTGPEFVLLLHRLIISLLLSVPLYLLCRAAFRGQIFSATWPHGQKSLVSLSLSCFVGVVFGPPPPGVGQLCGTLGKCQARDKLRTPRRPTAGTVCPNPPVTSAWGNSSLILA